MQRPASCKHQVFSDIFPLIHLLVKEAYFLGVSPSGKARDFDSRTRRFESCYPSQAAMSEQM